MVPFGSVTVMQPVYELITRIAINFEFRFIMYQSFITSSLNAFKMNNWLRNNVFFRKSFGQFRCV